MTRNVQFYNSVFQQVAAETGMPADILFAMAMLESGMNPLAVGDGGQSHGLFQIYRSAHPDISIEQARDPLFAARWTANNFMNAYDNYGSYEAAIIHHNHPVGAAYYANNDGKFMTEKNQWYLTTVVGYQDQYKGGTKTKTNMPDGQLPPDAQANGQDQGDYADLFPNFSEFPDITEEEFQQMLGEPVGQSASAAFDVAAGNPFAGTAAGAVTPFDISEGYQTPGVTSGAIGELYQPSQTGPEPGSTDEPNTPLPTQVLALREAEQEEEGG
jgi:Mannosyl-glycoprotein endo-beta-N-acetylglucosaminidase